MDNSKFTEIQIMKYHTMTVIPTIFTDALTYEETLSKVVQRLNELINNNNQLPEYIQNLIESYITSGAIGEVVREILADFMLNVKNPPNNLTPAVGDGTADDTEAIQGCIDYARDLNGGCVYVPNGVYLTRSLVLYDNVSLFGFDPYSARLVLKGGATSAMFTGNVTNTSITGLTLDGNREIQVNNINVFDITAEELRLTNLVLTGGEILVNVTVNKTMQISNVICDYSVVRHMQISGAGNVLGTNLYLHDISTLRGTNLVTLNVSNSVINNINSMGQAPIAFIINGNNNNISGTVNNAILPFQDNGNNNTIVNNGKTVQEKITGNKINIVGGNEVNEITGTSEIKANEIILNPNNPLTYKTPQTIDEYFKYITFKDLSGVNYKVLVEGAEGINGLFENINQKIEIETNARELADTGLQDNINLETTARQNADTELQNNINSETTARQNADEELQDNINSETTARQNADEELQDNINSETTARQNADEILTNLINENNVYLNVKSFGAIGDGVTNDTEAFQNALNVIGKKTIYVPSGVYIVKNLIIDSYTTLQGESKENSILKLPNGCVAGDCILKSKNFDALTLTNSNGGVSGVTISQLRFNGNRTNNIYGYGIKKYGYRWVMYDVDVHQCAQVGIYTEWGLNMGAPDDGRYMEEIWTNIRVYHNSGDGIIFRGGHDPILSNIFVYLNHGYGFKLERSELFSGDGATFNGFHAYANGNTGLYLGAQCQGYGIISESNNGQEGGSGGNGIEILAQNILLEGVYCYTNTIGKGIVLNSRNCRITGILNNNLKGISITDGGDNYIYLKIWSNTTQYPIHETAPVFNNTSDWKLSCTGNDAKEIRKPIVKGFVWKSLPTNIGSGYSVENTFNFPVMIYTVGGSGVKIIDIGNTTNDLGDCTSFMLNPKEKVWYETTLPSSWIMQPLLS